MRGRAILFILTVLLIGSSCVTNKKYLYLQTEEELDTEWPTDSVLRVYPQTFEEYLLQPGDVVRVQIESLTPEEYDIFATTGANQQNMAGAGGQGGAMALMGHLIDDEGNVDFPAIGKVGLEGLTIFEAEEKLELLAAEYLENPVLSVRMVNFRFTVLGEVGQQSVITTFNHKVSMVEAIGLAGGLGELADRSEIKVIRQKNGIASIHYINMLEEQTLSSPFYYVQANDIIVVPPLNQRPFRNYFGSNLSIFVSSLSTLLLILNLFR